MNNQHKKYSQNHQALPDLELVKAYKETLETHYIGVLYQRYQHIVTGICLKYLKDKPMANDACLELFNNLFSNLVKYEVHDFKSWLLTIARNHCQRILKEQARIVPLNPAIELSMMNEIEIEPDRDELNQHEDLLNKLAETMKNLKPEQEVCVRLFYIDGHSYDQIASLTGFNLNKVKSHIQNGKRNLQIALNNMIKP